MTGKKTPREFLGAELQRRREAAGLTQARLGERVMCSESLIGHFESGRRRPTKDVLALLDRLLETDGFLSRLGDELDQGPYLPQFLSVTEAELTATALADYAACLVPGLLQTPDYARAVYRAAFPTESELEIGRRVTARMERGKLLDDPPVPSYWVILHEVALFTCVGGREVMAAQLRKISDLVRAHRIVLQILPVSTGAHALMEGMCRLLSFPDAPDLVYVEGPGHAVIDEDPVAVQHIHRLYDLARAAALDRTASLERIEAAAKEFENVSSSRSVSPGGVAQVDPQL